MQTVMIKSQSKDMVIKGQFDCSFCHSDHCAPENYDQPLKLGPNKQFKKMVEESLHMPLIFCEKHPELVVSKFCRKHQSLICNKCMVSDHLDHS